VPDEDIDRALERIAQQQRNSEAVERPAEHGDAVVIDFTGRLDGTEFPGGSAKGHALELGSGSFIPGFEDQLVGAAAGEQRTVDVTFPADYGNTDLAGKAAQFEVDVKEVRRITPQPIDESLATAVGMENLQALRDAVREQIERDYGGIARQRLKRALLDKLAERHDFPVPQSMVDLELESIWRQFEQERERAKSRGVAEPEDGKSDDELKGEYRGIAERRVRLGLLLSEVGRRNNIQVTQDELNRALSEEARRFPGQERQVIEFYRNNPGAVDNLRAPIYENKVIDFILEMADVTERSIPAKELLAGDEEDDAETKPEAPADAASPA
jgi:trigger factor